MAAIVQIKDGWLGSVVEAERRILEPEGVTGYRVWRGA